MDNNIQKYAVYIGDVALDEYYRCRRWPAIADKEHVEALGNIPGGMIANAACVRAALGAKTLFWTKLNGGAVSRFLLEDLQKRGIDTSLSLRDDSLPDAKTLIFLTGDEHTVFIPTLYYEAFDISEEMYQVLSQASYLYSTIGDLLKLRYQGTFFKDFSHKLRKQGVKVIVDYDVDYKRDDDGRFRCVDIGFFNQTGFASVCQGRSYEQQALKLHDLGMELVVVTLAEQGCILYPKGQPAIKVPAIKTEAVDVTGAGDTFCSSFVTVYEEMGIRKAAEFATAAASICIAGMGARAGAVAKEKIMALLDAHQRT